MGSSINETPKAHILGQKDVIRRIQRENRSTGATCARDEETKKDKERYQMYSRNLGIRRAHPRRRIEMKFCAVGGLQVSLTFEFHQHRLSGFGAVGVEICPVPLTWPLA